MSGLIKDDQKRTIAKYLIDRTKLQIEEEIGKGQQLTNSFCWIGKCPNLILPSSSGRSKIIVIF